MWFVDSEEPCFIDNLGWLDELNEDIVHTSTRDFLYITTININQNVLAIADKGNKKDENDTTIKKRMVDIL